MEVNTELARNGRVFVYRLSGELDLELVRKLTTQWEDEILKPATQPVYYISDFSNITHLPSGTLSNALSLARRPSPNLRLNVIITRSMFINKMANIMASVTKTFRMQVVSSEEEAWKVIDKALAEEAARNAPQS